MTTLADYLEDESVDLVDSILTDPDGNAYSYSTKAGRAIWATYRYAMLNTCASESGIERWIQRGRDIAYNLDERYSQLFAAYESFKTAGTLTSIDITETTTTTSSTEQSGTDSSSTTATSEDLPQYASASSGTWLTGRNASDGSGTTTGKSDTTATMSHASTGGALAGELIERMRDGLFNPYLEYAGEFRDLFVPFWSDECGCCE